MTEKTITLKALALLKVFLFCPLLVLFATSSPAQQTAFIGGTIKHAGALKLTINSQAVPVDQDGHFEHRFAIEKSSWIVLKVGQEMGFFMRPGDSLRIELDAEDFFGSFQIDGRGQELNRFLLRETYESVKLREHFNWKSKNTRAF